MTVATEEAIWLRHILKEIGFGQVGPSLICSKNQFDITLAKNLMFHHKKIKNQNQNSSIFHHEESSVWHLKASVLSIDKNYVDLFIKPILETQFCNLSRSFRFVKLPSRGIGA